MNEGQTGERMSAGASGKMRTGELEVRFADSIDIVKLRAMLAAARERAGAPLERILTLNLVGIHFSDASWEKALIGLEAASALHPARIVGLIAIPGEEESVVTARVAVARPKGAAFFVERIVLRASGKSVRRLESALTELLVPEVPIVVSWGGRMEGALLKRALETADRFIVDSSTRPPSSLSEIDNLVGHGAPIGDLAWARIFPWQCLAAEVLDIPNLREHRGNIQTVKITSAGPPGAEAMLLAGWFISRIRNVDVSIVVGPEPSPDSAPPPVSPQLEVSGSGGKVNVVPPAPQRLLVGQIAALEFFAPPVTVALRREKNGILDAQVSGDDDGDVAHRLRLPAATPGSLLVQELKLLAGCDEVYASSLREASRFEASYRGSETPA